MGWRLNMAKAVCGRISRVIEGSPAFQSGVRPGDELLSIDSRPVRDILDYRFRTAEEQLVLTVRRGAQNCEYHIFKKAEEDLGLEFEEELFDGLLACGNNCIFCFYDQMPRGLRESLYVKDDDYRLSFAHGNYVTLTNLSDGDMERICEQRMSPLYISVHATEPDLRVRILRNDAAGRVMEQLRALANARIRMHAQVVLCPGVNDGDHLERTVRDLALLHPSVASIALVPVGLTKHREGLPALEPVGKELAREVLDSCARWQKRLKRSLGTRFVFASDEFYLLAGGSFPSAAAYEEFPQLEDGIGICRIFLDELRQLGRGAAGRHIRAGRYVLVTGMLASPVVQQLADLLNGFDRVSARTCIVENKFLGETVTVAGLLAGCDIAGALCDVREQEEVLVPAIALNNDRFLDDMTVSELQARVSGTINVVPPSPKAVLESLAGRSETGTRAVSCMGTRAQEGQRCQTLS